MYTGLSCILGQNISDAHPDGTDPHLHIAALRHGTDLITVTRVPLAPAYTHTPPKRQMHREVLGTGGNSCLSLCCTEGSMLLMEENSEIIKGSDRQKHFLRYIS